MPALSYSEYLEVLRTMRKSALKHDRRTSSKGLDSHGNFIFVSKATTFKLKPPVMLMDLLALKGSLLADRSSAIHRLQTQFWAAASVATVTRKAEEALSTIQAEIAAIDVRLNAVKAALGISVVAERENTERLTARLSHLTGKANELISGRDGSLDNDSIQQYIRVNRELLDTSQALAAERESEVTDTRYMMAEPSDISYTGVSAQAIRLHFF